jgi:hypothetical protein
MRASLVATGNVQQAAMEGVILRCNCGDRESHPGVVCPKAIAEVVGSMSFTHTDWRVRLAHNILAWSGWRYQLWVYGRAK